MSTAREPARHHRADDSVPCCWRCGTVTHEERSGVPWCPTCHCYLVHDRDTGDWISFAEQHHRLQAAVRQQEVAVSAAAVTAAMTLLPPLPDGWRVTPDQTMTEATHTIAVDPPSGSVDATAYLTPSTPDGHWWVQVHNRARGVSYPIYRNGGLHAAQYATAADALTAAITALRIVIVDARF